MFINEYMGFVILTESELEKICGEFFDKGYYTNFYRNDNTLGRTDNSTEIFSKCKDEILKGLKISDIEEAPNLGNM